MGEEWSRDSRPTNWRIQINTRTHTEKARSDTLDASLKQLLANLHDGKIPTYFWRQRHSIRDWLIRNLNRVGHLLQQRIGGARLTKDLMSGFKHSIQLIDLRLSCPSKPNRFRIELSYFCKKLSPIHSWHSQIGQHYLRCLLYTSPSPRD